MSTTSVRGSTSTWPASFGRRWWARSTAWLVGVAAFVVGIPAAAGAEPRAAPPPDLGAVAGRFTLWLLGLATAAAVLGFTVAGFFYMFSAGNPSQIERAKLIVRGVVLGYSLAVLAPVVLAAVQAIVG